MKDLFKRGLAMLLVLVLCISYLPGVTDAAYLDKSGWIKNWGTRDEVATEPSGKVSAFYTGNYTYEKLSALSGGTTSTVVDSALYKALHELMDSKQTAVTTYADTREMYAYTDCEKGTGAISSFYSGKAIGPAWDSGSTWNREHVWPNSKGDGDSENDIMMLRPTATNENGSRGNKAYGESSGFFNPNAASNGQHDVRGDVCRVALYVYVRWGGATNLANLWGSDGIIESLDVMLKWMELDPVDTWELGRNDAVQSMTGTRNVFVDYPELAFKLFNKEVPAELSTPSNGKGTSGGSGDSGQNPNGPTTPEEIVDAAYALEKDTALEGEYELTGVVTSIDTPYSSQYKNVSVVIAVKNREDKPILCYRLKGEGADQIVVGDTITVKGKLKNYNGTVEFDAGCELLKREATGTPDTFDPSKMTMQEIVDLAYALAEGESFTKEVTLTGKVTAAEAYSAQYKNVTVTIVIEGREDKPIVCYRMKGDEAANVVVGDTITVTGIIKNYKGTIEFDAGCVLNERNPGEGGDNGGEGGTPPVNPGTPVNPVGSLTVGTPYYLHSINANGDLFFNGDFASGRILGTADLSKAVTVKLEAGDAPGEYYIYFMAGNTKTYIAAEAKSSKTASFMLVTTRDASCVWIIDETAKTIVSKNFEGRGIATQVASTHDNFSTYAVSNFADAAYHTAWFMVADGESTAPGKDPTVTFQVPAGMDAVASQTVAAGTALSLPVAKAPALYTFLGWVKAELKTPTATKPEILTSLTVTEDITLYAVYSIEGTYTTAPCVHQSISVEAAPGDCMTDGHKAGTKCSLCHRILSGCESTGRGQHDFVKGQTVDSTATSVGCTVYTCSICGQSENRDWFIELIFSVPAGIAAVQTQRVYLATGLETLPTASASKGYTFLGWVKTQVDNAAQKPAEILTAFNDPTVTGNVTLLALYTYEKDGATVYTTVYTNDCLHLNTKLVERVEPTCTEIGYEAGVYCEDCGIYTEGYGVIEALGHDYKETVVEPTAAEAGYTLHKCDRCDDEYKDGHKDPLGYTVKFQVPEGLDAIADMNCQAGGITLPAAVAPQGYQFVGWVTAKVESSLIKPGTIYAAGSVYEATADVTLIALYSRTPSGSGWEKVLDAGQLKVGDKLILGHAASGAVAGAFPSGKTYLSKLDASLPTMPEDALILTLGGTAGAWTLADAQGNLLGVSSAKNGKLNFSGENATWTIAIEDGVANIINTWSQGRPEQLRFNNNKDQWRFANYDATKSLTETMLLPELYVQSAGQTVYTTNPKFQQTGGQEDKDPAKVVDAAWELEPGEKLEGTYTLTGVVTRIDTPYSEQYKNVTITIVVSGKTDKPIVCFRLKGEEAANVAVGDLVSVQGVLMNYNGTIEFDYGCVLISRGTNTNPGTGDMAPIFLLTALTAAAALILLRKKQTI